jgi:hypothetical protein
MGLFEILVKSPVQISDQKTSMNSGVKIRKFDVHNYFVKEYL